jgi:hypothetical protein
MVAPLAVSMACGGPKPSAGGGAGKKEVASEVAEAEGLLAAGRVDDALLRVQQSHAPEAFLLQGNAWAKKAETAPLPTPEAVPTGGVRGAVPIVPEFKAEELQAISYYEKAIAALPADPRSHYGLARLLAPHAQRRYDAESAAASAVKKSGAKASTPASPVPDGPDFSPARVAREYRAAAASPSATGTDFLDALYAFAVRADQFEDADWALRERIRKDNENPDHLIRYGDFLREVKKAPDAALEQYRQALMWRPDDAVAKAHMADIYIDKGIAHYQKKEYASAEAQYRDAAKWATDRSSEQWKRLERETERLRRERSQ